MKLIQYSQGCFYPDIQDIREHERPPMIRLPEYQRLQDMNERATA